MTNKMIKICIINTYFGKFPLNFDLWLKSAEFNDTIDFLIFTDQKSENYSIPKNVFFVKTNLFELETLASNKIGLKVYLKRPYKCCDLRPAYGIIFEDYISNYDYWGHCDLDLIWGDIRKFIENYNLSSYDKFLTLGHLSLYKNEKTNNNTFRLNGSLVGNYERVFTDKHNFAFDETYGILQIYKKNNRKVFEERIFADISKIYHRFRLALNDKNYKHQIFLWENGHIYRAYYEDNLLKKDEYIYIHFKERKKMFINNVCKNSSKFYITNKGFYENDNSNISLEMIDEYNKYPGYLFELKESYRYKISEKINRVFTKIKQILNQKENIR